MMMNTEKSNLLYGLWQAETIAGHEQEGENERKERKSERHCVARKGFLASVINLTVGQISWSFETANPLKQKHS